jgi:hypothetical protein
MSGYLQRLASSVLSPGGSIHPVLTPVFSPSSSSMGPENIGEERVASSSNEPSNNIREESPMARPELVPPAAARNIPDTEPPAAISSDPLALQPSPKSERKARAVPIEEDRTSFKPLVNKDQIEKAEKPPVSSMKAKQEAPGLAKLEDTSAKNNGAEVIRQPGTPVFDVSPQPAIASTADKAMLKPNVEPVSEESVPSRTSENATQSRDAGKPEIAFGDSYTPLVAEYAARTDALKIFAATTRPALPDVRREAGSSRGFREPEREPDEIQIHIGRIEVTAAPPAAVRPAPKPERKALSLDDYLKRKRGRA